MNPAAAPDGGNDRPTFHRTKLGPRSSVEMNIFWAAEPTTSRSKAVSGQRVHIRAFLRVGVHI